MKSEAPSAGMPALPWELGVSQTGCTTSCCAMLMRQILEFQLFLYIINVDPLKSYTDCI